MWPRPTIKKELSCLDTQSNQAHIERTLDGHGPCDVILPRLNVESLKSGGFPLLGDEGIVITKHGTISSVIHGHRKHTVM